ncbi:MAG: aldehyde dehydrogenase [Nitrososphaerota archaeon]|nr:aldehyde dehydrogenase [Nitrososphaerota archaeon]MDG6939366.1 aldehyde dehydrogenase [Nitrososphaerota archaeon]
MKMLIDGEFVDSATGDTMDVLNPATEEVVDSVPKGGAEEARQAIDSAERAFESGWWSSLYRSRERGRILWRFKDLVREKEDELARLLTLEQGKVLKESLSEVRSLQNTFEYYAGFGGKIRGDVAYIEDGQNVLEVKNIKKPIGVCGAIVPFNFPLSLMAWKVAPALVAGNTVVLKPASSTPLTDIRVVELMQKAGVPKGVVNVVTGPSGTVGREIVENEKVRKVAFTGSTETGKSILRTAAKNIKKVTLELGGSDPTIVCESADLGLAARTVASGRFRNAGQSCTAVKRVFVFENVLRDFLGKLREEVSKITVGNGLEAGVEMGPVNNPEQRELTEGLVADAVGRGARLLFGGKRPEGLNKGFFYEPTLLADVPGESKIFREECFGPALPVTAVSGMDEAIAKANDTCYGLGAAIWTRDDGERTRAERDIRSGMLWVNYKPLSAPEAPFGGVKESGIGRELGFEGLEEYLETMSVRALHPPPA